jgi:hypothetical protein
VRHLRAGQTIPNQRRLTTREPPLRSAQRREVEAGALRRDGARLRSAP